MTIKRKLFISGMLILLAFASIGAITGVTVRHRQEAQVRRNIGAVADLQRQSLTDTLASTSERLTFAMTSERLADHVSAWAASHSAADAQAVGDVIDRITPLLSAIRAITVVGSDGTVIADSSPLGAGFIPAVTTPADIAVGLAGIANGAPEWVVRAAEIGVGDARYIHVMPIPDASQPVGYLVTECDLAPIQKLTDASFVLGQTAETSLVQRTDSGAQVFSKLRFKSAAPFSITVPFERTNSPAVLALNGPPITRGGLTDYRSHQVIAAMRRIPTTSWAIVVKIDAGEANLGMERVLSAGALGFGIAGAIGVMAIVVAFGSVLRRVRKVATAAGELSTGDLTARVSDDSPDEIGKLARSFNKMADTLVADMAHRQRAEADLAHSARHDPLTGLPNRLAFDDELTQSLSVQSAPGAVGVLFCDLDDFKTVNDDLGHTAGDMLLREVATRLRGATGRQHILARFGGDEFVVVARGLSGVSEAVELGERMAEALTAPITLVGREVFVTTSVGVAIGRAGSTSETLVRDADAAMYQAKDIGRNRVVVHDATIGARTNNRLAMGSELQRAIAHRGLTMALQKIVDLQTGETYAFEALVRWVHEGREIDPSEFVLRATEMDLAGALDRWVLDEACRTMSVIDHSRLAATGWLHVNVTGTSLLDDEFADDVLRVLRRHDVPPNALCLEIVEDRLGGAPGVALRNLARLRRDGVRVAIDDFGTGHSSLARLRDLPADTVKIDQSFVCDLATDPTSQAIAASIISLAKRLGLEVIAEGIESEEQRQALVAIGCRYGQGFLLGFPFPAGEVVERSAVR